MKEIWKNIEGFEDYQISNLGNVKSKKRKKGKYLKLSKDTSGYYQVKLFNCKNENKIKQVHRLVAQAFISNPNKLPQVNHKDENKTNNCVENLEWCTNYYNTRYSLSKKINQYDINGNFIKTWNCIKDASRELKIHDGRISACCKGKRKCEGGYIWKYVDDF